MSEEKVAPSEQFADVIAAIRLHGDDLAQLPGVVSIQPGYRVTGGRVSQQPAVLVKVLRKLDIAELAAGALAPRKLGTVLVDVAQASAWEQWAYLQRQAVLETADAAFSVAEALTDRPGAEDLSVAAAAASVSLRPYQPPAEPLAAVEEMMTVVLHASPDAGWRNLRGFLAATQQRLSATMYEFNAGYILDALEQALSGGQELHFIMDGGSANTAPSAAQGDVAKTQVRQRLAQALGARFEFTWAAVADDGKSVSSFFPSAYHIKTAVRDGASLWLSSGNWKRSGQPELDPLNANLTPAEAWRFQTRQGNNREWHVIADSPDLAGLFETYIRHDIAESAPLQNPQSFPHPLAPLPDLFVREELAEALFLAGPPRFFPELTLTKKLRVQPLLTPDTVSGNYAQHILPLIANAREKLYFQNQSLSPSRTNPLYRQLLQALIDKSQDAGVDVRIIVSEYADLQKLAAAGFEMSRVRAQKDCHNKGLIVDDKLTLVGSHNWTGQGATANRDASLLFDDEEVAAYYTEIFLYDWNNLARPGASGFTPFVARAGENTPPGMARLAWDEVFPSWQESLVV